MKNIISRLIRYSCKRYPRYSYPLLKKIYRYEVKRFNLDRGIFCISFDNDYAADNDASYTLLQMFKNYELNVTWAVVGKWMQTNPKLHEEMLKNGHELMNHSWSHPDNCELRPGDTRKFNELSDAEIEEEITKCHELCLREFGYKMIGFRMPHFRKHPHIASVLRTLNYQYTSNHLGLSAPTLGMPYNTVEGWAEIPLSPIPRIPRRIVESYRLYRNPDGLYADENRFYTDFKDLIDVTKENKLITAIYLDASDIIKLHTPAFQSYLELLRQSDLDIMTFRNVAKIIQDSEIKQ